MTVNGSKIIEAETFKNIVMIYNVLENNFQLIEKFIKQLPYELTKDQANTINEILENAKKASVGQISLTPLSSDGAMQGYSAICILL